MAIKPAFTLASSVTDELPQKDGSFVAFPLPVASLAIVRFLLDIRLIDQHLNGTDRKDPPPATTLHFISYHLHSHLVDDFRSPSLRQMGSPHYDTGADPRHDIEFPHEQESDTASAQSSSHDHDSVAEVS